MTDRVQAAALFKTKVGPRQIHRGVDRGGPAAQAADLRGINNLMTDFYDDPGFCARFVRVHPRPRVAFRPRPNRGGGGPHRLWGTRLASLVGPKLYEELVLPFEKRMVDGLHAMGTRVRLHICGNTRRILKGMGSLGCEIVDLDLAPIGEGRQAMGARADLVWGISTRCTCCATAPPRRSPPRWRSATGRRKANSSWARAARCPGAPRRPTCERSRAMPSTINCSRLASLGTGD